MAHRLHLPLYRIGNTVALAHVQYCILNILPRSKPNVSRYQIWNKTLQRGSDRAKTNVWRFESELTHHQSTSVYRQAGNPTWPNPRYTLPLVSLSPCFRNRRRDSNGGLLACICDRRHRRPGRHRRWCSCLRRRLGRKAEKVQVVEKDRDSCRRPARTPPRCRSKGRARLLLHRLRAKRLMCLFTICSVSSV